ncbi:1-aminocyclopropane-1-carboxylate deaminase, partial [Burkholderia pseudomallei]
RSGLVAERASADVALFGAFRTETTYTAKTLALLAGGGLQRLRVLFWNTYISIEPDPSRDAGGSCSWPDGEPSAHSATAP